MANKSKKEMADSYGLKETKEALKLIFALADVLVKAVENDGHITISDVRLLTRVFPYVLPAIKDINKIPNELKHLDSEKIKEIAIFASVQLSGLVDVDDELINKSLNATIAIADLLLYILDKKRV